MLEVDKIYCGRAEELLEEIDTDSIDLTVTSPPYDNIRDYKGYTFNMKVFKKIARELYRVTKPGRMVVWVVSDQTKDFDETLTSMKQALYFKRTGFKMYDTMIYKKKGVSKPAQHRYFQVWEYMFVLCKGRPQVLNLLRDKKNKWAGYPAKFRLRDKDGVVRNKGNPDAKIKEYGIRENVWEYNTGYMNSTTDQIAFKHPAIFPDALAKDHILSWSNPGDLVLDPFCGSGTTCKQAKLLGRHYIGIDVSEEYIKIAKERLKQEPITAWEKYDTGHRTDR